MSSDPIDTAGRRKPRPWTEADDKVLSQMIEARQPPAKIARKLHRTVDAVRGRAAQLHLVLPSPLRPWRMGVRRNNIQEK
ncbi:MULTISPECIES: hypothetical protein [unclassified Sphingomonas]|jgi:hypothetical protein|uniref:hypothetical protein n=1 Tax=unclassified Sphingomonas TaxID=196159 RepID=UPI0008298DA1|nr:MULTISPECIES: hypothetical protein [unclassified Sphingomonas]MBA4763011.1 hypothetical protein [Sphingomonas sp.]